MPFLCFTLLGVIRLFRFNIRFIVGIEGGFSLYIPVENHTKFQLKTIPLINAYLHSFFNKWVKSNHDKHEYKTEDYSS